jgi:SPRY domain/Zinc finger, C3HC4 type (RING finger)
MQLGFASRLSAFNEQEGVGDDEYSFAFDGHRVRRWHIAAPLRYGESWRCGDVISVRVNIGERTISFGRNGRDLGVAFRSLETPVALFPALTLAGGETALVRWHSFAFDDCDSHVVGIDSVPAETVDAHLQMFERLCALHERSASMDGADVLVEASQIVAQPLSAAAAASFGAVHVWPQFLAARVSSLLEWLLDVLAAMTHMFGGSDAFGSALLLECAETLHRRCDARVDKHALVLVIDALTERGMRCADHLVFLELLFANEFVASCIGEPRDDDSVAASSSSSMPSARSAINALADRFAIDDGWFRLDRSGSLLRSPKLSRQFFCHRYLLAQRAPMESARVLLDAERVFWQATRIGGLVSHLCKEFATACANNEDDDELLLPLEQAIFYHLGVLPVRAELSAARRQRALAERSLGDASMEFVRKQIGQELNVLDFRIARAEEALGAGGSGRLDAHLAFAERMASFLVRAAAAANGGRLFSFVPEWAMEALVDALHLLATATPAPPPLPAACVEWLLDGVAFDRRVVLSDLRRSVELLAEVLLERAMLPRTGDSGRRLLSTLVEALATSRLQAPVALLSLTHTYALSADAVGAHRWQPSFVHKLLDLGNWVLSEFVISIDAPHPERSKKSVATFQLAATTLDVLAAIAEHALKGAFLSSEVLQQRLVELAIVVLTRTASWSRHHQLDSLFDVDELLKPVARAVGALHSANLLCLLVDHPDQLSFDAHFHLLLEHGLIDETSPLANAVRLELEASRERESQRSIAASSSNGSSVLSQHASSSSSSSSSSSVSSLTSSLSGTAAASKMCTICYSYTPDAIFEPCGHRSCHRCIQRHLESGPHTRCFFCNLDVQSFSLEDI